jgi:CheY-like chemotaxis protein
MPATAGTGQKPLILCVDDCPEVLDSISAVLESRGFNVITANGVQDALSKFASQPIAAVVLDYEMPKMNGLQVALTMKNMNPHIPTVLFTAAIAVPRAEELMDVVVGKSEGAGVLAAILRRVTDTSCPRPVTVRRFQRYPVHLQITFLAGASPQIEAHESICVSISERGFGSYAKTELAPGDLVEVLIAVPDSDAPIKQMAQVRYRHGDYYGFAFVGGTVQDQEIIQAFCRRLQITRADTL